MWKNEESEMEEGWYTPLTARKSHYFRDGRSLCGTWRIIPTLKIKVELKPEPDMTPCTTCLKKLKPETKPQTKT